MRLRKYKPLVPRVRNCLYVCEQCGTKERVPTDVLAFFDAVDPGEPDRPATFQCQQCPGIMYPDEYLRAKRATP
jgi:uncharacterized Zn finger protein